MRFFRRIAGIFGFGREDGHEVKDQDKEDEEVSDSNKQEQPVNRPAYQESGLPRKGFSVPVKVAVERSNPGPVLLPCSSGEGGVQGLRWHAKRLKVDEDGDVADEFLDEVLAASTESDERQFPRFEVKHRTTPARVKTQVIFPDGRFQQCVEHRGALQWV